MRSALLKNFKFSLPLSLGALIIAGLMLKASAWQWQRYQWKIELVKSYDQNSTSAPLTLPKDGPLPRELVYRKVKLEGRYDFRKEFLIINRKHGSGPGSWIVTPFLSDGRYYFVSRGFIPFQDSNSKGCRKYDLNEQESLIAVIQPSVKESVLEPAALVDEPATERDVTKWRYPDLTRMAGQLDMPIETSFYLQRLGGYPPAPFPAESISIEVPPQTHFGYTIEWILLALATLAGSFALQAFPQLFLRPGRKQAAPPTG